MNWPIFLIGIAAGWIIEWVVDLLFWRKRQKQWVAAESEYRTQLAEVGTELEGQKAQVVQVGAVQADLATAQAETEALRTQLATVEAERDRLGAQLAGVDAERQTLVERLTGLSGLAATAPAAAGAALVAMARGEQVDLEKASQEAGDDLTVIEGIGPKIQELLYQNGIHSYADLADCDVELLRAVLAGGGAAFRLADPSSWPRQARLAVAHDWVRLAALKQQLTGGVRHPAEPAPEDDLTMIEGIGTKISACLKEHGIRTFHQLARTDIQQLQAILAEAGPSFKLAARAVESWPEQARLADDGAWDQLHDLKDRLKAGHEDAG